MGSRSDFDFEIDVPCLDITIDPNDAENGAKEVLALITDLDKVHFEVHVG
jgi:hypothetical protein